MKTIKVCPQCGANFMGRSNQRYCSDRCKVVAFREGKTQKGEVHEASNGANETDPVLLKINPDKETRRATSSRSDSSSNRFQLKLRRLELEHERQVKQMDIEEAQRQRMHEQTLARFKAEERDQAVNLQSSIQLLNDVPTQIVAPLTEWEHYSLGVRRSYESLVRAIIDATPPVFNRWDCQRWLDGCASLQKRVQEIVKRQGLPAQAQKPFWHLAELAQLIDIYRRTASEDEEPLEIPRVLRQQLIQACL